MLLSRYAREEDVIVGTEHADRHQAELRGAVHCTANPLALRTDLSGPLPAALVCQLVLQPTQLIGDDWRALQPCLDNLSASFTLVDIERCKAATTATWDKCSTAPSAIAVTGRAS